MGWPGRPAAKGKAREVDVLMFGGKTIGVGHVVILALVSDAYGWGRER